MPIAKTKVPEEEQYMLTEFEKPKVDPPPPEMQFHPDELLQRMNFAAYEYRQAIEGMRKLETSKNLREKKAMVIIGARRFDMLTNTKLAEYLQVTFTVDPKLRPTKEQYEAWIYIEHQQVFDAYRFWEAQAKQAEKDHEHWGRQLSWYQSELKHDGIELSVLNRQKG